MKKILLFLNYFLRLVLLIFCLYLGKFELNIYTLLAGFLLLSLLGKCCLFSKLFEKIQFFTDKDKYYLKELPRLNPEPVVIFSNTGEIVYQNLSAKKNLSKIEKFSDAFTEDIEHVIKEELTLKIIYQMVENKQITWYEFFAKGTKKNSSVVMYGFNIDSLIEAQNKLEKNFTIDSLTGLGNRKKINQDVANSSVGIQALACMDIMKFGELNAFYGHKLGDILIVSFAQFLQQFSQTCKCIKGIYRLNGNTFAVLFKYSLNRGSSVKEEIEEHLKDFISQLHAQVFGDELVDISIDVRAGASIALEEKGLLHDARRLILEAEIALQEAKKEDKSIVFYSQLDGIEKDYSRNIKISKKLRDILIYEKSEAKIVPYFQPVYSMKNRTIKRYEVLARIVEGDNVKSPWEFLEAAKKLRLLPKITEQMYRKSLEIFSQTEYSFSINITTQDLESKPLLNLLEKLCQEYNFAPEKILLEVVEDEDIYAYKETINYLQSQGFKVAIDDFGTGYSNFKKLQDIKAEIIKIDGSLIKNIAHSEEDFELVKSIVSYGRSISAKIVAEFVSSKEIYDKLLELDVDFMQGYYIGKPKPNLQEESLDFL